MNNRFKQTQLFGEESPRRKPATRVQFAAPKKPTPLWQQLFLYLPLYLFCLLSPLAILFAMVMTLFSTLLTWHPFAWLGL